MTSNFGHVERVTAEVGGKTYTFRSKLEYRWGVWCQIRKEQGIIVDWEYESEQIKYETKLGEIKIYRPDFTIEYEDRYEYEETKGWFTGKDYTRMKFVSEQYANPLTLIFAGLTNCKSKRAQYSRAKELEELLESNGGRIIYNASRDIFKPIRGFFDY